MPIIKSITRKDTNFRQLVNYVFKHDSKQEVSFSLFQNMNGVGEIDQEQIIERFKQNNTYRKKRANGIGVYHDVISFGKEDQQYIKDHPYLLEDIGRKYMQLRFPNAIGIVKPHFDKDHIHLHVVYSPNNKGSDVSVRISKAEFNKIRRSLEEYQLKYYPELTTSYVHSRDSIKKQKQSKIFEWNDYGHKDNLRTRIRNCVSNSTSLAEIESKLIEQNLQPYYRKSVLQGVIFENKKYRLTSLVKENEAQKSSIQTLQRKERERITIKDLEK